ncbi:MAG: bifunctional folylpolyglutamate synthase/dihydrofolate synthase [Acidimicrobiales bacterium]
MDYRSALAYLDRHTNLEGNRGDRFGPTMPTAGATSGLSLEPMRQLLAVLGDPHHAYRAVHITGTNGKGSTARFVTALVQATDLSVGTYTSPNIESINERISYGGEPISDEAFGQVIGLLAGVEPLLDVAPSRFELLTAAAYVWFAEMGVEVAVVEVGLLGRYDATNVIDGDVAVVTNIGKDHTTGGERWRQEVAQEKAGIIKPGSHLVLGTDMADLTPIFVAEGPAETWMAGHEFRVEANRLAVGGRVIDLETPEARYEELFLPFHGAHQGDNLATAVAAAEAFFQRPLDQDLVEFALTTVELPARFEVIGREPTVVLDGAHNPDGARAAAATLDEAFARLGSWVLVVGMVGGKDPTEMLEAFGAADFDAVICCQPDWSRAVPATEIAAAAQALGLNPEVVADPVEALQRALAVTAADDLIFVGGSLYVVGEVRATARSLLRRPTEGEFDHDVDGDDGDEVDDDDVDGDVGEGRYDLDLDLDLPDDPEDR